MAEENKQEEKVEVPEMEQRALSMGWRPKDEWAGAEDDFIDAKEFVRRKPLFDRIDQTTKRLKTVEETLGNLAQHHQRVKEVEYQRAYKTLRDEKRVALKEGDTVKALEYEDQMDVLTQERQEELTATQNQAAIDAQRAASGPTQDFQNWVKTNQWYLQDEDMHDFADGAAAAFIQRAKTKGTQLTEQEVFNYVKDKITRAYPEKFENRNRERASTVSTSDQSGKGNKLKFSPTAEQRSVAASWVKQGIYKTEQEYYKELQDIEESK